ncbi:MAG: phosphatase PAP2 family protein [Bacteroidetes bacterium]|nr:phosphatase PAP2 family protein [Bacteroidota bacterium]
MNRKKIFMLSLVVILVSQCNRDVSFDESLPALQPSRLDENAGTWKMIYMSSPGQVAVAAPLPVSDPSYQSELTSIKDLQSKLNPTQKSIIDYWSGGGVLRWNQILRELVARYNLPPAPLADGSYPVPDAENPFADPNFPFANPPYAARAYSYVAVAQYEAMKAAWYYKYFYNRPAPYTVDNGIQALVPKTALPAYPSEDAVLSGVSAELLKSLFPAAVEEITKKAAEQRSAALWSGKAAASDLSAGLSLGKSIAALFTARAASDGMKTAGGNKAQWQMLVDNAVARGEIPWLSLDLPSRPPMLPFFGLRTIGGTPVGVKAWMMTDADIVNDRPLPPPPTASAEMQDQVNEVKYYSQNLTRERLAIVHKWADGAGTYTPPGHWNDIAAEYIRDARYSEVRAARVFALLNIALHDAAVACWETKYYYFNPRPTQMDPAIRTGTGIPNFPSYASGHSTFSGASAAVLSYLFPSSAQYFSDQATEASLSRLYGGIHYRIDCNTGLTHGNKVASHTITFAGNDGAGN